MKTFLAVVLTALPAAAFAQSSNRYGDASTPPPLPANRAEIESAFSNSTAAPAASGGRYGSGAAPSLPPSTPVTARDSRPPASGSRPLQATPRSGSSTRSPNGSSTRAQPARRTQPTPAVVLPEASRSSSPPGGATDSRSILTTNRKPSHAQRMMTQMLRPRSGSRLRGTPITVADATRGSRTRGEQSQRVEAYWDLCASVADYYLGLLEEDEYARLRRELPAISQSLLAAEQAIHNRVETSLQAATAGQRRLAGLMGIPTALPLPADGPFCGPYRTEFEEMFAGRSTSTPAVAEALLLHNLLPSRHAELAKAAQAVARSEKFVDTVKGRSQGSDGTGMLRALELLALNRRAFVQIAKDYNRRIARYAELSMPGHVDTDMLVAMLVGSSDRVAIGSPASLR